MNNFSNFYLIGEAQTIAPVKFNFDLRKQSASLAEINGGEYEEIKNFLTAKAGTKEQIVIGDKKAFVVNKIARSDENNSKISGVIILPHETSKILEIIKYDTNVGSIYLFTSQGKTQYYYIFSDKNFSKFAGKHIRDHVRTIISYVNKQKEEARSTEEIKKSEQEQAKQAELEKQKAEADKIGAEKKAQEQAKKKASIEKGKSTRQKNLEAKKAKEAEIKKLGASHPANGRFGYFDIDYDDFNELRKKFKSSDNGWIGAKKEYKWETETKLSDFQPFGVGYVYHIKGSTQNPTKGQIGTVYIFAYHKNVLPNVAMLVFDKEVAFNVFKEIQILKTNDKIGKEAKVRLTDASQLRWTNEDPHQLTPPMMADNVDDIYKLKQKSKVSPKSKWDEADQALLDSLALDYSSGDMSAEDKKLYSELVKRYNATHPKESRWYDRAMAMLEIL